MAEPAATASAAIVQLQALFHRQFNNKHMTKISPVKPRTQM